MTHTSSWIEPNLRRALIAPMPEETVVTQAARHDRRFRPRDVRVRKAIGMTIGTICLLGGRAPGTTTGLSSRLLGVSAGLWRRCRDCMQPLHDGAIGARTTVCTAT